MTYIGFLLVDNPLKSSTKPTLNQLNFNGIKCAMITGDNIYTGVSVGFSSGLIPEGKNIWVGEYKALKKEIKWTFFHNNDIGKKFEKTSVENSIIVDNISASALSYSKIMESKIQRVKGKTLDKQVDILNVLTDLNLSGTAVIAIDGLSFVKLREDFKKESKTLNLILDNVYVYGRAKPNHKELIIKEIRKQVEKDDYTVGFVGDGANDCKALNAANLGLSIGNSESSITSSFSTTRDDIGSVMDIIIQGKFFLESSMQLYKISMASGLIDLFVICALAVLNLSFSNHHYAILLLPYPPAYILICLTLAGKMTPLYPVAGLINR